MPKFGVINERRNRLHEVVRLSGINIRVAGEEKPLTIKVEWSGSDWGRPERLDETINTPGHEGFPWFAPDGRLFFASKGHPGYGGYDLFVTQQDSTGKWTPPLNLGRPLNSPLDDITIFLDVSGQSGYFSSTREGEDDDLYYWYQDTLPGKEEEE